MERNLDDSERSLAVISEEMIDDLKRKHGDKLSLLVSGDVEVVVRKPSSGDMKRWRADTADAARRSIANENLVRSCVVFPAPAEMKTILEDLPGLVEEFIEPLLKLTGLSGQATIQKL